MTGVSGQSGAYLAQFLLEKGYEVYGTYRRTSFVNFWRIEELGNMDARRNCWESKCTLEALCDIKSRLEKK